jgi:glycosyltransferase involved in cell wall biosynthesis
MIVSIVIPVYNEEQTIQTILERVQSVKLSLQKEIIVVDDCSTDRTRNILGDMKNHGNDNLTIIHHDKNRGKGAALRTGFHAANGDIVIIQDADLEYNPDEYHHLLEPILHGNADVVYGSRFMGGAPHRVLFFWHYVGNKFLTILSNMFSNLNLTDMETGYKVFRKEILSQIVIKENRFGFEPEITAKISRLDCRIYEIGISYSGRTYKEGKKINWKDGVWAIWCIIRYGLFP